MPARFSMYEYFFQFLIALVIVLLLGIVIILATGSDPLTAYISGFESAAGTFSRFLNTLTNTTILIMTGLACSVAFNAGIWNIGAEGQLYLGGFAAALVGLITGIPKFIHLPLTLLAAAVIGMIWAFIPGILRVKRETNEIVVTLMMNYIAILLCSFLVNYPFKEPGASWPTTRTILPTAQLAYLYPLTRFNSCFFIAIAAIILIMLIFKKSRFGYECRMVGLNEQAAKLGGVNVGGIMLSAMIISGLLAGLAGGMEVIGIRHSFMEGFSADYGMTGLLIALIAKNDPVRVGIVAFTFAFLKSAASGMELFTNVPTELSAILQTLIVLFLAASDQFIPWLRKLVGKSVHAEVRV